MLFQLATSSAAQMPRLVALRLSAGQVLHLVALALPRGQASARSFAPGLAWAQAE
jgi:hypothetical protein